MSTILDKLIYTLSPRWGARRMAVRRAFSIAQETDKRWMTRRQGRHLGSSVVEWEGADTGDRLRHNWNTSSRDIDSALLDHLPTLRDRCSDLYRTDPYAHAAVESRVGNEVGVGMAYCPRVKAVGRTITERQSKLINETLQDVMNQKSVSGMDRTGRLHLGALQRLMVRSYANTGELFIELGARPGRGPIPLAIDIQEPSRFATPPGRWNDPLVRMGIRYDADGAIIGYYRTKNHPNSTYAISMGSDTDYDYVPAFDERGRPRLLHVFEPLFPKQSRGIPWLASGMARFRDLHDYLEAEIIAKQIEACFAAFVKASPDQDPYGLAQANSTATDANLRRLEDIEPGMIEYLDQGQDITFSNPNRPGNGFAPYIEFSLRSLASAGNIPYEILSKNFFRTTFSSGRLAMLDGRVGFRMRSDSLIHQALIPIGNEVCWEAVATGLLPWVKPGEYASNPWIYERHTWKMPGWSYIDPEKEMKANQIGIESNQLTVTDTLQERGDSFDDFRERRKTEREQLLRDDLELERLEMELRTQYGLPQREEEGDEDNANGDSARRSGEDQD